MNDIEQLDITLVTDSLSEIEITLWGMKATFFGIDFRYHRDRNVVIVATGLRTKKVGGKICLSSTQATNITFNPRLEKLTELAQHIANEYGEFICPVPEETHRGEYVIPTEVPEYSTLQNLLATTVWTHQKYSCRVTMLDVLCNQRGPTTCFTCNQEVMIHGNTYYCIHCARKYITPIKSTGIPLLVKDGTCATTMTIRGRELKQLTGFHLNHFMQYYKDIGTTPGCLHRIKGSHCTFELQLIPTTASTATGDILITKLNQYTNLRGRQH